VRSPATQEFAWPLALETLRDEFIRHGVDWDEHQEKLRPQWPDLQRKPSEITASDQVAFTCEPEESTLPYVLERIGEAQVMYASDMRTGTASSPTPFVC
jgi:hypothetical protein